MGVSESVTEKNTWGAIPHGHTLVDIWKYSSAYLFRESPIVVLLIGVVKVRTTRQSLQNGAPHDVFDPQQEIMRPNNLTAAASEADTFTMACVPFGSVTNFGYFA